MPFIFLLFPLALPIFLNARGHVFIKKKGNKIIIMKKLQNNKLQDLQYTTSEDTENFFYSHDIGLVACLLCRKFELVGLDKAMASKVLFILKKKKGIDEEITKYWNFKSPVDAQSYFNQIKRLKNQIFSS